MNGERDPRLAAVNALGEQERRRAYSDALWDEFLSGAGLSGRDAALAARLYYGVLQNRILLDAHLAQRCDLPLKKLHSRVRNVLRVGLYQILFCDRIPASAAVNEAVKETRLVGVPRAAGLVNAVLRRAAASPALERGFASETERLSVLYSHPEALVRLLAADVPDVEALLAADNTVPPVSVRPNPLKTDAADLTRRLAGLDPRPGPGGTLLLGGPASGLTGRDEYRSGLFSVQDSSSLLAVRALDPAPGQLIVDGAAAPGGKCLAAAELAGDKARILAFDIYENKLELIRQGARRLGISSVTAALRSAAEPDPDLCGRADRVIADLPCSGLGVIRKKPDVRYKDLSGLEALPALQLSWLDALSRYVRPGGVMVYSTCTVLKRENGGVVRAFLAGHPDFSPEPFFPDAGPSFRAPAGELTLLPHVHGTDGFFIARLRRRD